MTRIRNAAGRAGLPLVAVMAMSAAACTEAGGPDFCRDHHRVHAQHEDSVATLDIDLSEAGMLTKELQLPAAGRDAESIADAFALQADAGCSAGESTVQRVGNGLRAFYVTDCGTGNRLRQIDVSIFERLPDLDELEVTMTTPVTRKRFVISRQCEQPIFGLD